MKTKTITLAWLVLIIFIFIASNKTRAEEVSIPELQESLNYFITEDEDNVYVMLPLRAILQEYASIEWEKDTKEIYISCGALDIKMHIGTREYGINGDTGLLEIAPMLIDGVSYVPASFFERNFGFWLENVQENAIDLFIPSYIIKNI